MMTRKYVGKATAGRRGLDWRLRAAVLLLAAFGLVGHARADYTTDTVAFAASGKYDELERLLEPMAAKGPLGTRDLHALCFAYSKTKRYNLLLPCLDRLEANVKKGDRRTRLFGLEDATPAVHAMRAEALIELGQYAQGAKEAQRALKWLEDDQSDDKDMIVQSLAAMSIGSTLSGNRAVGEKYADRIAAVSTFLPQHRDYLTAKSMALARAYLALGKFDKALRSLEDDSRFKINAFLDNLVSGALFKGASNWAWVELPRAYMIHKAQKEIGRLNDAKAGFDKLLALPQIRANGEIYWLILYDRGLLAHAEGQLGQAMDLYRKAVDVIEIQRSTINTETNKIGFVGDKQAVYAQLIRAAIAAQKQELAYEYAERARARALVDLLAERQDFALPKSVSTQVNVKSLLASYRDAGREAMVQRPVDMSQGGESRQRNLVVSAGAALQSAAPELASLVSVQTPSTKEILAQIPAGEVIVEYYFAGQELYAFVLRDGHLRVARLDPTGLDGKIRDFRNQLQLRGPAAEDLARSLYTQLIQPLEADIKADQILFIPSGILHYLPFTALHDGKDYLVLRRSVRYLPSASVLRFLKPVRAVDLKSMLILGNPDLGDSRFDLPNAENEAKEIAALIPESQLLVRGKASKFAFKQFAQNFSYLHIASHGEFNGDEPLKSRLLLAKDSADDGNLTAGDIYDLKLDANLVTMSACETGLGHVANGDDIIGLTRALLYAGTSNVVASLWQVDDLATSLLMTAFYKNLMKGDPVRLALRNAQQSVKARMPHPFFWAPFFVVGQG